MERQEKEQTNHDQLDQIVKVDVIIFFGMFKYASSFLRSLDINVALFEPNRSKCCFIELIFVLDDVEDVAEHFTCVF